MVSNIIYDLVDKMNNSFLKEIFHPKSSLPINIASKLLSAMLQRGVKLPFRCFQFVGFLLVLSESHLRYQSFSESKPMCRCVRVTSRRRTRRQVLYSNASSRTPRL